MAKKKTKFETLADQMAAIDNTATFDCVKNMLRTLVEVAAEQDQRGQELIDALAANTAALNALKAPAKKKAK